MVQPNKVPIEVPETWDTIKYEKPVYPTYSRGKVGATLFCNSKYHCYSVHHSKPYYELMPYRATGFGFSERSMKYIPLTHVQNRSKVPPKKVVYEISEMDKIYNRMRMNCVRQEMDEKSISNIEKSNKNHEFKDSRNKIDEFIGETRYRTHLMDRMVRDNQDMMRS